MSISALTWRRITLAAIFLPLLLWLLLQWVPQERHLTLLHFNDFHGQLAPYPEDNPKASAGGIARLAGTVEAIRKEDPRRTLVLLFGGDLLQGTMLSSLHHGHPDLAMLNALGLDAAVMGNHELDYGQENFIALLKEARFPWLAANAAIPGTQGLLRPSAIVEGKDGLRIGILGLTTSELVTTTHPRNSKGVTLIDPLTAARGQLTALEAKTQVQILLSHLGFAEDRRMARELQGIDLIVGGHNHFAFEQPKREGEVMILQAGERGRWLGRLDIKIKGDRLELESYRLIPINADSPADPVMAGQVEAMSKEVSKEMDRVVGRALVPLDGRRESVRRKESNLGNFCADAARKLTQVDVVLFNGGTFRDSIGAGAVTLGKIHRVFPFGNELVTGTLPGSELQAALDQSAALDPEDNPGGFLQVSGLRFVIAGGRAVDVKVGDKPLDPSAQYRIATSDFLAEGGDGYSRFAQALQQKISTGNRLLDMVVTAFEENPGGIGTAVDGRIERR
ncbi:MAG: bifunctional metallophosphatase/5'-nucleotidase [Gammaproteobacteria bacterium]|nr:bifunctional metallophosphatase/5'-nucleotidase [Gammaproteobacteria bacterium]MBU1655127.1 bifunctional metallophosphatase/5'-nucleotidase [Gammaproteobacteria bacterium]MBU1961599.1 bifunctional metallophosphatase/5'-nucleotidase [Gammaproteobacteria bacterium]